VIDNRTRAIGGMLEGVFACFHCCVWLKSCLPLQRLSTLAAAAKVAASGQLRPASDSVAVHFAVVLVILNIEPGMTFGNVPVSEG
jgi:hypothetical protein